ncbi:PepSY domain-containing protein [Comamonas sp. C11]|uniref:PepSY domain-containing protein n=1 Tax=Comamonas sp. C11 TaxID=2966554 RepID=UPI002112A4F2|nr:PepSY domain-containing protein [Comamonas sp. C11]UUC91750.1 PepSY domain-containing protein [Comamonas sp. C11]
MRLHLKRWLFLLHRWLGIAICLFFALWFVSGMVMMYVGYPKLTEAERLRHLPPLDGTAALLSPAQALRSAGIEGPLKDLRLHAGSAGRPSYLATPEGRRQPVAIDALSGQVLRGTSQAQALASAAAFAGSGQGLRYLGSVQEDAFSHSRALDMHRPLHRVQLDDAEGTLLYISGTTAEVVRDATRGERGWNYLGAWLHWLYMFRGNAFDPYWADLVNVLSLIGIAVAVTGTVVGVIRWRFRRPYRSGRRTPYPGRAMRWHHVAGLLFALTTLAWIFSGLMSMNPWRLFDTGTPPLRMAAWQEGSLGVSQGDATAQALLDAAGGQVRELRWIRAAGRSEVLARTSTGAPQVLDSASATSVAHQRDVLLARAARLIDAPVLRSEWLTAHDLYWYERAEHTMMGGHDKPLPLLRVVFGDAAASWVHIDPQTGQVLGRMDRSQRVKRWLFAMLHSWDWLPLLQRRPLWDVLLLAFSLGGLMLSATGVLIGLRRLRRKRGHHARPHTSTEAIAHG